MNEFAIFNVVTGAAETVTSQNFTDTVLFELIVGAVGVGGRAVRESVIFVSLLGVGVQPLESSVITLDIHLVKERELEVL